MPVAQPKNLKKIDVNLPAITHDFISLKQSTILDES